MLPKADETPGGDHTATCLSEDPEIEPEENFPPCVTATEHTSPVVRLIQTTRLPSRHVRLVRVRVLDPST